MKIDKQEKNWTQFSSKHGSVNHDLADPLKNHLDDQDPIQKVMDGVRGSLSQLKLLNFNDKYSKQIGLLSPVIDVCTRGVEVDLDRVAAASGLGR